MTFGGHIFSPPFTTLVQGLSLGHVNPQVALGKKKFFLFFLLLSLLANFTKEKPRALGAIKVTVKGRGCEILQLSLARGDLADLE